MKHPALGPVIAVANQKGGVGKTTTALNLAASIAALDREVLVVDLDPQGNATTGLGLDKKAIAPSTLDVLLGEAGLAETIRPTGIEGLRIAPATTDLAAAGVQLADAEAREHRLHKACAAYDGQRFACVFVDCPPALNLLTINALVAADHVLVPLQTEFFAMEGLAQLLDTIRRVRARLNPGLSLLGVLLTMADRRNKLAQEVEAEVRRYFGAQALRTVIPRNVRLSEAPSHGLPVLHYDARSAGAVAYLEAAAEILARLEGGMP